MIRSNEVEELNEKLLYHGYQTQSEEILLLLRKENDRGLVLLAAALIDDAMKELLKAVLRKGSTTTNSLKDRGTLGNNWARLTMLYSLFLISNREREFAVGIAELRNDCAHKVQSFTLKENKDKIMNICSIYFKETPDLNLTLREALEYISSGLYFELKKKTHFILEEKFQINTKHIDEKINLQRIEAFRLFQSSNLEE